MPNTVLIMEQVLDTSSNYMYGLSELLVNDGNAASSSYVCDVLVISLVVHELINNNELSREEIVIVTKAGYIQGSATHAFCATVHETTTHVPLVSLNPTPQTHHMHAL